MQMNLGRGTKIKKYFEGHGFATGELRRQEEVQSTLYPGRTRQAWLVSYADGHEEHFEEEELRSGRDGKTAPENGDGKPSVIVVKHLPQRKGILKTLEEGLDYLEARLSGDCQANFSCKDMYAICRVVRAFNPNFAAAYVDEAFIEGMHCVTPIRTLLQALKEELPAYLSAAAEAPSFHTGDVDTFSEKILRWWRGNHDQFPSWGAAARKVFALTPNSAGCERVFSLLKTLFGDQQYAALADMLRSSLMMRYNSRTVG
ncbi:hypothetical protein AB1Y20_002765 [Prymnesium parvum]|uniref:HAT C-terminal dimerisation domain-containing protein n=1 Tax=Prymnesium parvum TaxID=97485 RepID=A0AB34J9I4_PRYPA